MDKECQAVLMPDSPSEMLCGGRMLPRNLDLNFAKVINNGFGIRNMGVRLAALLLAVASIVRNTSFLLPFGNIRTHAMWFLLSSLFLCTMKGEESGFMTTRTHCDLTNS